MSTEPGKRRTLLWFRHDLRTEDNPALVQAMGRGEVVAVYCLCLRQWQQHDVGPNRLDFLYRSLLALRRRLDQLRVPLRILDPDTFAAVADSLMGLATAFGCDALAFNAEYPVNEDRRDRAVGRLFQGSGRKVFRHHGSLIRPPGTVLTNSGGTYTVFTPFKKKWLAELPADALEPLAGPKAQKALPDVAASPEADLAPLQAAARAAQGGLAERWAAGEEAAAARLRNFVGADIHGYKDQRDLPDVAGTSTLSPYLSVGAISPRQCLVSARTAGDDPGTSTWISELVWREFYRHIIDAFPDLSMGRAFRPDMDQVAWRQAPAELLAWQQGRTGYPIVDAAQRQLLATGWMHNRLRMVSAMFLTKHLLINWRQGERWFMQHLVDGDFASNNGGWQWSASTGTDAQPWFRIFNPVTQGERFDQGGAFVCRYLPELQGLPAKVVHQPWLLGQQAPKDYPGPIVEHKMARERALAAFKQASSQR